MITRTTKAGQRLLTGLLLLGLTFAAQATTLTRTSGFTYDAVSGLLIKEIIEPDTSNLCLVTEYIYDGYGNKTSATTRNCNGSAGEAAAPSGDPIIASRANGNAYDSRGQFPTSSTNALNQSETKTYNATFGTVTSLTGPNGLATAWAYDSFGRKTAEKRADGNGTTWSYQYCIGINGGSATCPTIGGAGGAYIVITTPVAGPIVINSDGTLGSTGAPNGAIGKTYYDALNREIRFETQGFDGYTAIYKDTQYDSLGRPYMVSRPYYNAQGNGQSTVYWTTTTFDALGRVVTTRQADNSTATIAYNGLTTIVTNANNQTRSTTRNSQGQIVSITDSQGKKISYAYDPFGNLGLTVDSLGNRTAIGYDLRGRKTQMIDPDMGTWTYAYDALGQLIRQTNAKGQISTLAYDNLGRMTSRGEADLISSWYYDTYKGGGACNKGIGKLCQAETTTGYNRTHNYDTLGRPIATSTTLDATYTASQTYDSMGRLASQTYPGGKAVKYIYTALGHLYEVRDNASNALYWRAVTQDAEGRLLLQTHGNNILTQQTYNPTNGRLTGILAGAGNGVQNFTYGYDSLGNLTTRTDANQNLSETFTYDSLNRVSTATVNAAGAGIVTQTFGYDELGNLISKSDLGSYRYNASGASSVRPHALTRVDLNAGTGGGYRTFQYDANGNLTAAAQYDNSNNVIAARGRSGGYTSFNMPQFIDGPSISTSFAYGPEHQRVRQMSGSLGTTYYLNPGSDGELGYEKDIKTDGSVEERSFITAYGQVVAVMKRITQSGTTTYPVSYFHRDHLGSTTTVTNEAGAVVERLAYEAFGKRRFASGVQDPTGSIVPLNTDRGFTNHEHIDELGVIHMNGRIYDPTIGRFMSADPNIQDPYNLLSYNRYSYVWNSPLNGTDPSGYFNLGHFLSSTWKDIWNSSVGRVAVTFAIAWATGTYIDGWMGSSAMTSGSSSTFANLTYSTTTTTLAGEAVATGYTLTTTGSAVVGAGAGFASGYVGSGGNFQAGLKGAGSGALFGAVDGYYGNKWSLERVAVKSFTGGVAESIQGGRFGDGFLTSGVMSGARYAYNSLVGYDATGASGENRLGGTGGTDYTPDPDSRRLLSGDIGRNIIGFNENYEPNNGCLFCANTFRQGSPLSKALNAIPGGNAIGGLDDYINNRLPTPLGESPWFKAVTIPTAVGVTLPALFDRVPVYRPFDGFGRR